MKEEAAAAVKMLVSSDEKDAPGRVVSDAKEVLWGELIDVLPCVGMSDA